MTRTDRAIPIFRTCYSPLSLSVLCVAFLLSACASNDPIAATVAQRDIPAAIVVPHVDPEIASGFSAIVEPALPPDAGADATPSVEVTAHRFYCVEFARQRSGIAIFGDAKTWWKRARNLYPEFAQPVSNAVMVFAGSRRIVRGHVAVVTKLLSQREIVVDQANWENRGEIDHAAHVLDVSVRNDWSKVRVWDIPSGRFGARTYAVKGFIAPSLAAAARKAGEVVAQTQGSSAP